MRSSTCLPTGRRARAAVASLVLAAGLGAGSVAATPSDPADRGLRTLAVRAGQGAPVMRIGLEAEDAVRLTGSGGGLRLVDPATGADLWRTSYDGEVAVVPEGAPANPAPPVYRVQVGAYGTRRAAEAERDRLSARLGVPGVVTYVPDRGSWRVRLGEARDRDALAPLLERLRSDGASGVWIAEEPGAEIAGVTLRLVDTRTWESHATGLDRVAATSEPSGAIGVDGKPYRGIAEIRVTPFGTVRAINWVELETYLRGVVPSELGPEVWPQLEALKAQAVAARTYAWRNRGQFGDEGFDLCATPRCQVYGGRTAEHPLSDRAVAETRGEIATYHGKPISALYTATCGGHTEDAGEIFPEERAPYLVGVPCRAEREALEHLRGVVRGRPVTPVSDETGRDVGRDRALLAAAGVLDPSDDAERLRRPLTSGALDGWAGRLARLAGRPAAGPAEDAPYPSLGAAAAALVAAVGWDERAEVLLSEDDLRGVLRDPAASTLPEGEERALAYLVSVGALAPFPDGTLHVSTPPTAARLLPALARIGEAYAAFGLRRATVAGIDGASLDLREGKGSLRTAVAGDAALVGLSGERATPVERLELWPGDRVRFRLGASGRIDYLELLPPVNGLSDDRGSAVYSWEVRRTRRELETAINRRVDVGTLRKLEVLRRGVSGRVTALEVVGDRGTTEVRGFDIRRLLDLRESLVVIEPQRDAAGRLEAVVFAGKGWGHGVGLCQVGAYGMALRGKSYRQILKHYYTGVAIEKKAR